MKHCQFRKSPSLLARISLTTCPFSMPYLHPHSRLLLSQMKSRSGTFRSIFTVCVFSGFSVLLISPAMIT